MDKLLGSLIDDYTLYKIIEAIILILILIMVYLGIQIGLILKFSKDRDDAFSLKKIFTRSSIFIFITGFFMLIHEFTEGLEANAPDFATDELLELIAFLGLVLFLYDWRKILRNK